MFGDDFNDDGMNGVQLSARMREDVRPDGRVSLQSASSSQPYAPLDGAGAAGASIEPSTWRDDLAVKRVKTKVGTLTCSCCCRLTTYSLVAFVCAFGCFLLVSVRDYVFRSTTTEDWYFSDTMLPYLNFLQWGDSGADELAGGLNFTKEAQQKAYGDGLLDPVGWTNLCPYSAMEAFVVGATDEDHCSLSAAARDQGVYLPGCEAGFFQPVDTSSGSRSWNSSSSHDHFPWGDDDEVGVRGDSNLKGDDTVNSGGGGGGGGGGGIRYQVGAEPQPCPAGWFCPRNLPCTIACVPGAQCQLSVFVAVLRNGSYGQRWCERYIDP